MTTAGDNLLNKVRTQTDLFKAIGRVCDKEERFDPRILTLVDGEDLRLLLHSDAASHPLSVSDEAEFYFHAGKYCSSVRNYFLVTCGMVALTIAKFGSPPQVARYLKRFTEDRTTASLAITEPLAGSNISEISTSYLLDGDGFILNGKKRWITLGGIAEVVLLVANGPEGVLLFIVDARDHAFERSEMTGLLSNRGSHIAELQFSELRLSTACLLGEDKQVSKRALDFALMSGRAISGMSAIAMAQAALEEAIDYAKERRQFGKALWEHQLIQGMIGEAQASILAGHQLCLKAFEMRRRGVGFEAMQSCAAAKLFASQVIQKITTDAVQMLGANGMTSDFNVERYYREARAFQFIEGTTQVLIQMLARGALKGVPRLWDA